MTAPDLTTYRSVHLALRGGAHALAGAVTGIGPDNRPRVTALARYWEGYAAEVLLHHRVEDETFFPALVGQVPLAGEMIARTDVEHHELDVIMDRCGTAVDELVVGIVSDDLGEAFAELAAHMVHHLDFEDDDILPLFERHFTAEAYEAMEQAAMKSLGIGRQAAFTVPFIAYFLDDAARAVVLGTAPLPFRILYRLTRRGHARLAATAFGASAPALAVARCSPPWRSAPPTA